MLRPRRAKHKPVQSHEIVGLLPSEEAAIQKALMASIAKPSKASPTEGPASSPKLPRTLPKKMAHLQPVVSVQRSTRNYSRSITPGSISISPLSLTSEVSFLSSDSLSSSTAWTPSRSTPTTKVRGRKKVTSKKINVKKAPLKQSPENTARKASVSKLKGNTLKTKPIKQKRKLSLSSNGNNGSLKSIHRAKEMLKTKKAKVIARAVRKKANMADEPRNEAGLTVDEILMSVAKSNKLSQRSKSKGQKIKTHKKQSLIAITRTSKQKSLNTPKSKNSQKFPSPTKGTPKTTPVKVLKSLRVGQILSTPKKSLSPEALPQVSNSSQASQEVPLPAESAIQAERESVDRQSLNSFSYQAQRKFASNHSPPAQPSNQELTIPPRLKETPKTEDFLHFLCLRGGRAIPECYKKFELPWTPVKQVVDKETNGRKLSQDKTVGVGYGLTAKKLDFTSEIQVK